MRSRSERSVHSIDTWRFFAAFLVVCVHFPMAGNAGAIAITYAKTAVPFFIIASGYFCYREDRREFARRLIRQIIKLAVYCILANVLFFGISYYLSGVSSLEIYKVMCMKPGAWKDFWLYNESPFAGHLWFLGSMVYAMLIVLLLTELRIHKYVFFLSPLLLGVYIIMARSGKYEFIQCRNALFCTMPYFMYGCLMRRYEDKVVRVLNKRAVAAALLFLIAATFLEYWNYKDINITFIGPELIDIVLVIFLIQNKNIGKNTVFEWFGRRDTLFIYIAHFILVLWFYQKLSSDMPSYLTNFGTVIIFAVTLVSAEVYQACKRLFRQVYQKAVKYKE